MSSNFLILKGIRLPHMLYLTQLVVLLCMIPRCIFEKLLLTYLIEHMESAQTPAVSGGGTSQVAPTSLQHLSPPTMVAEASCNPRAPPHCQGKEGQMARAFDPPLGVGSQHTYLQLSLVRWM